MILRNAAVRHGRRAVASPISRCALRQLSTESNPTAAAAADASPGAAEESDAFIIGGMASKKKKRNLYDGIRSIGADSTQEHEGPAWTRPHKLGRGEHVFTPAEQMAEFMRIQKNTRRLGSRMEKGYSPSELVRNPPALEDLSLELLMSSQTHLGHNTKLWSPSNSRYIFGVRQGIHIISLETTSAHLRRAARVVEEVSYRGGLVLFVGTRKGQREIVTKAAQMAGACHLFTKWTPGSITNRDVLLQGHATKVVNEMDEELKDFDVYRGTDRPLIPDLVVCLNPGDNFPMLYECGLATVPTIGVIDTNVDPSWVTYTIPANDDSLRSVALIGGILGRAGGVGQARRKQDVENGTVPWKTDPKIVRHMEKQVKLAVQKQKEVMGQLQSQLEGFTEEEQKLLQSQYVAETTEVSEEDMVGMMGTAALGEAREAVEAAGGVPTEEKAPATKQAQQPKTGRAKTAKTERGAAGNQKGTLATRLGDIESQLEGVKAIAIEIENGVAGSEKSK